MRVNFIEALKSRILLGFFLSLVFVLGACSHTKCERGLRVDSSPRVKSDVPSQEDAVTPVHQRVRVFKPDGSLQCGQGRAIAVEVMAKELAGIKIYSQKRLNDGQMRIQVCGSPTGEANVYEIPKENLEDALKKGFLQWTFSY